MTTAAALAPGTCLAGFRIESLVGRGGMGIVYRATQLSLERHVALKLISPALASEERFRERFLREARLAASLEHPHLLPVYEAGEAQGTLFLAMRLVEGVSLSELLRSEGRLSPERALRLYSQLGQALACAHEAGLLHRDVKPQNVLVTGSEEREHAYLCDFGLARRLSGGSLTRERAFLGTAAYAAPEQIRGEPLDRRADLYSLSCLLYESLTGEPPFVREDELALCWAHLHEPAPAPGSVDPALSSFDPFFARALAKDPTERYPSAAELAQSAQAALAGALPAPPPPGLPQLKLPRPLTSFLGRERELQELLALLLDEDTRLLTLTGPGGTGKTRLALRAAEEAAPAFPDGVYWVGLAALRDPALVAETISQVLEAKGELAGHIGERRLLLLLDNFEQVVESAPELTSLLQSCPYLRLLVTSRELLRVRGEVEYPVPPLAQPEATELFCARSGLEPSEEIAELCARLDNLPLAVELAAARTKALTVSQILERLSQRLDLLKGGRDADPRQQTLRATIEWSYDLLSPEEQQLFCRLSVFAGGCTLEAAEEVADADLDTLQSLVEKSLLRFSSERYWMLETIREYAAEKLHASSEERAQRDAHTAYYVRWAEGAAPRLRGPTQAEWLGRVDLELDNLRALLEWSLESQPERALRVGAALRRYWWARSLLHEGRMWLERLVPIARSGSDEASVLVLSGAGALAREQGEYQVAVGLAEEALELAQELGNPVHLAGTEHEVALVLDLIGEDLSRARGLYERALSRRRELGDLVGVVQDLNGVSGVALAQGDTTEARVLLTEALGLARELGDRESIAGTLANLAAISLEEDSDEVDLDWVISALHESLRLSRELGNPAWICECLDKLATAEHMAGRDGDAVRLFGTAASLREEIGAPLPPQELAKYEKTIDSLRRSLDEDSFSRFWEDGRAAPLDDVLQAILR